MAISINHATKVITIPQADLTFISGSLYELNVNTFRKSLKDLEDDVDGMILLDTHRHNTEVTLAGVTLARTVEIINGFTITFENLQYSVRCVGANHNISDVKNVNQVSLIIGNSAGLIVSGSGVTAQDKTDIASKVLDEIISSHTTSGSLGQSVTAVKAKTDNLPSGVPKGVGLNNFAFVMIDSTGHVAPKTGLTVSGQISKDGGIFAALTNAVVEVGNGIYRVNLTATEMTASTITLRFTANGADDQIITMITST